jgi:hypothetical protein
MAPSFSYFAKSSLKLGLALLLLLGFFAEFPDGPVRLVSRLVLTDLAHLFSSCPQSVESFNGNSRDSF